MDRMHKLRELVKFSLKFTWSGMPGLYHLKVVDKNFNCNLLIILIHRILISINLADM